MKPHHSHSPSQLSLQLGDDPDCQDSAAEPVASAALPSTNLHCNEAVAALSAATSGCAHRTGAIAHVDVAALAQEWPGLAEDLALVEKWVAARTHEARSSVCADRSPTACAYRREATRFVVWLLVERGHHLSDAVLDDAVGYRDFLADPQPRGRWCGDHGARRGSPAWRPFSGPLSARSRRQAMIVVSSMFGFLRDHQFVPGNPFSGVARPRLVSPLMDATRRLNVAQWGLVEQELRRHSRAGDPTRDGDDLNAGAHAERQLAWAVRLLFTTGLRLAEVVSLSCGDFSWIDCPVDPLDQGDNSSAALAGGWVVNVMGKGGRRRVVPVPTALVDQLGELLVAQGARSSDPRDLQSQPLLVSRCDLRAAALRRTGTPQRMSVQSFHRQIKQLFKRVAADARSEGRDRDAAVLEAATTHWLRHTFGSHSIAAGVPVDVVQQNLGHASLAMTTRYVESGLARRIRESSRHQVKSRC
jgi:integrase